MSGKIGETETKNFATEATEVTEIKKKAFCLVR